MMNGFDIDTIKSVNKLTKSPLIASGGCGNPKHASSLLKKSIVSGLSISSMFHFSQFTPLDVKEHLRRQKFKIRK